MAFLVWLVAALLCGFGLVFSVPVSDLSSPVPPVSVAEIAGIQDSPLDAVNALLLSPAQIIAGVGELPSDPVVTAEPDSSDIYYYSSPSIDASQSAAPADTDTQTQTENPVPFATAEPDPDDIYYYPGPSQSAGPSDTLTEPSTTTTITVPIAPSISTVTVFVPTSPQSSSPASATSTSTTVVAKTSWAVPAQISDLSVFNISAFPAGQQNLALVTGIPASASATKGSSTTADPLLPAFLIPAPTSGGGAPSNTDQNPYLRWSNTTTALQLFYPTHSANPAARPVGGAEFYATPLSLAFSRAKVAELTYSVFFPANFDWVKAGKLPGLYGGRAGCSGGDSAVDCFSTRLMWRQEGKGELYLYAPKDAQSPALCADPQSVCDAAYGLSIGRGSFSWCAGGWTTVTQIVRLNTPGKQDGGFALYVDGKRRIWREDIYYRGVPPNTSKSASPVPSNSASGPPSDGDGDDEDPLLGLPSLLPDLGLLNPRMMAGPFLPPVPMPTLAPQQVELTADGTHEWAVQLAPAQADLATGKTTSTVTTTSTVIVYPTLLPDSEQAVSRTEPVGFVGIFFSTFFGGHGASYTTPKDQYVWFKDFALVLEE